MRKWKNKLILAIGFLLLLGGTSASAVSSAPERPPLTDTVYLSLDGVPGESTARGYERWIELTGVEFGVSNSSASPGGSGSVAGRASVDSFSVSKRLDSASPLLLQAALTGRAAKSGKLVFLKPGESPAPRLSIDLGAVSVTDYAFDNAHETVRFKFDAIQFSYFPTLPNGTKAPPVAANWNFKVNAPR
ncbi:Hcp family type VI secretion system effector [Paenibacillaceae bacterium WGS1546]|uniref:Hcp family type VI secretion system effector n=1 Tax=Cohnella sp. WGS1546 TaxID=3366810 RepID=UPI00372D72EE